MYPGHLVIHVAEAGRAERRHTPQVSGISFLCFQTDGVRQGAMFDQGFRNTQAACAEARIEEYVARFALGPEAWGNSVEAQHKAIDRFDKLSEVVHQLVASATTPLSHIARLSPFAHGSSLSVDLTDSNTLGSSGSPGELGGSGQSLGIEL